MNNIIIRDINVMRLTIGSQHKYQPLIRSFKLQNDYLFNLFKDTSQKDRHCDKINFNRVISNK